MFAPRMPRTLATPRPVSPSSPRGDVRRREIASRGRGCRRRKTRAQNLQAKRRRVVSRTSRSSETSPPSITASPRKSTSLRDRTHSRFSGKSVWMSEHAKTRAGRGTFASGASTEPLADADMLEAEEETEARGSVRRGREKTGAMTGEGRRVGASARGFDAGVCARRRDATSRGCGEGCRGRAHVRSVQAGDVPSPPRFDETRVGS